jgi:hypothetical protein
MPDDQWTPIRREANDVAAVQLSDHYRAGATGAGAVRPPATRSTILIRDDRRGDWWTAAWQVRMVGDAAGPPAPPVPAGHVAAATRA